MQQNGKRTKLGAGDGLFYVAMGIFGFILIMFGYVLLKGYT